MKPPLIIIGSAPCVIADISALPLVSCDYMLVGLSSVDKWLGRADYFVTMHPDDIPKSLARRQQFGGNTDFLQVISHTTQREEGDGSVTNFPGVTMIQPYEKPPGSSALLGVFAALKLGYERIILAGCPLDETVPHNTFINGRTFQAQPYTDYQRGWQHHLDRYIGKVRSLSGWTKQFLGYPTEEWLNG